MKKKYFLLLVMGIFFAGVLINFASAAMPSSYGGVDWGKGISLDDLSNLSNWTNLGFWVKFLSYLVAPFLFIYLVLYGFLEDANIFSREKINSAIALLLTLMAFPTGVLSRFVWFLSQFAVLGAVGIFFSIFILFLSQRYRKKAAEYQYILGSRFLTQLVIHSPILFFSILAGIELGGTLLTGNLPDYLRLSIALVTAFVSLLLIYVIINGVSENKVISYVFSLLGGLVVYVLIANFNKDVSGAGYLYGVLIGIDAGMMWVGLGMIAHGKESSRVRAVLAGEGNTVEEYSAVKLIRDTLTLRTKMRCDKFVPHMQQVLTKNKELLKKWGYGELVDKLLSGKLCDTEGKNLQSTYEEIIMSIEKMLDVKIQELEDQLNATTHLLLMGRKKYKE